jgi:tubulin-specific chaperone A
VAYYKEEVKENELKLEEMKSNCDKDAYDVKRFEQVLGESYMMVPDSTKRLQRALEDLSAFIRNDDDENEASVAFVDKTGEWFQTAEQLLRENYHQTGQNNDGCGNNEIVAETSVDDLADGEAF